MSGELDETAAIRIVTQVAQTVLSFCETDKIRQTVCIRLARLFSDYGAEFGRRCANTKQTPVPRVAVAAIDEALSRSDTEKRKPSWMGEDFDTQGNERPTDPAGLVNYEPVLKKDQR